MTQDDFNIMTRTIYGEARGEYVLTGVLGLQAVAFVIMNRFYQSKDTSIANVCQKPYQFSCWNKGDPNLDLLMDSVLEQTPLFQICQDVALQVSSTNTPDFTLGANHYHAKSITPYWASPNDLTLILGNHVFYKLEPQKKSF